jgi:DNA invertase Pin-like site-specific DNA recombinase
MTSDGETGPVKAAAWFRVSTGHQDTDNQWPDVERFAIHHGYEIAQRYTVSDTAWKNGGGPEYRKALKQALDDAHAGTFTVLIVWALDRIVRDDEGGAEAALRIFRQFRQRGCTVISVKESWLNGAPEVQDVLIAFAGWMAGRESARRSERIRAGLDKRRAQGLPVGRQQGATDTGRRKRAGYVASWEDGQRRAAHAEGQRKRTVTTQGVYQARADQGGLR